MDDFLSNAVRGLGIRLPYILICVAGLVVALMRWSRHPRTSLLALLGSATLLLSSLATIVVYDLVSLAINRWAMAMERAETLFTATSFVAFTVDAIGVALLLVAVFRERGVRRAPGAGM